MYTPLPWRPLVLALKFLLEECTNMISPQGKSLKSLARTDTVPINRYALRNRFSYLQRKGVLHG